MEDRKEKHDKNEKENVTLVRILGRDIRGDMKVLAGLTKISGISWAFGGAICKTLNLDKDKKIQELTPQEIEKIEKISDIEGIPSFMKNRQKDFDDGDDKHLMGPDLRLRKEFDIKRLKKIRSYKGVRHNVGLPVRGQRTKANFRKNRKKSGAVGVNKKK